MRLKSTVIVYLIILAGAYSCEKKDIAFGQDLAESYTHLTVVDSVTPYLETYKLDSFPTSGTNVVLMGSYKDNVFGNISSKSFFQLNIPAIATDISTDAVFDSLTLIVKLNKSYYGDTSGIQQMEVHEISEKVELTNNATSFYNNSAFSYKPDVLGSTGLLIRPNVTDTIAIRLSDNKGREIFGMLQQKSSTVTDATQFQDYLKGLVIAPTINGTAAIYGVNASDSTIRMRVCYHEKGIAFVNKFIDFPYAGNNLQFNQVTADRSGTVLNNLPNRNPEIPSEQLQNAAYVQSATGLMAKVRFPTLRNLLQVTQYGNILKAELIIKPLNTSYNDVYLLPPQLELVRTDQYNAVGAAITNTTNANAQYGNLSIDYTYNAQTNYTYDITSFLQQEIKTDVNAANGLLIYPPSPAYATAFNRLVFGDANNKNAGIQLKIYYLTVTP